MADQADTTISNTTNPALPLAGTLPLSRGGEPGRTPALLNRRVDQPVGARDSGVEARKLIVGRETSLSGEIASCDRLVVEGSVEANLQNCQHVEITDTGVFKGNAAIDNAEVSGRFDGDLVVRKRLLIRASGHVSGTITYGEIEVEAGGRISGVIHAPEGPKGLRAIAASLLRETPNGAGDGDRAEHD